MKPCKVTARCKTFRTEDELRKAEVAAQAAGIAAEQSPRVLQLREKLKVGTNLDALADEVYSHLLTFFSRYYEGGEFSGAASLYRTWARKIHDPLQRGRGEDGMGQYGPVLHQVL